MFPVGSLDPTQGRVLLESVESRACLLLAPKCVEALGSSTLSLLLKEVWYKKLREEVNAR